MRKTPKEMADMPDAVSGAREELHNWLVTASARELQEYIHNVSVDPMSHKYQRARTALDIRLAEDAEISTRRIVRLTWGLIALTVALLFITIALYEDTHEQIKRDQLKEHRDAKRP